MVTFLGKTKNSVFLLAVLALSVILLLFFYLKGANVGRVCVGGRCFLVELASSEARRARGLVGKDFLPPNRGMLFIFEQEGDHAMWMRGTKIPLDMVFIDKNKVVVSVVENQPPCLVSSCPAILAGQRSLYVLEVNAGAARPAGFTEGRSVTIEKGK